MPTVQNHVRITSVTGQPPGSWWRPSACAAAEGWPGQGPAANAFSGMPLQGIDVQYSRYLDIKGPIIPK